MPTLPLSLPAVPRLLQNTLEGAGGAGVRRRGAGMRRATTTPGCGTGSGQRASGAGGGDSRQRVSGGSALMRGWAAGWAGAAAARPGCKVAGHGGRVQCGRAASSPAGDAGTRATVGASVAADASSVAGMSSSGRVWFVEVTRSEEHTSELQSRESISYAVFCLDRKSGRVGKECVNPCRSRWSPYH